MRLKRKSPVAIIVSTETSTDGSRLTYYALRSHHVTGCFDGVSAPADILNVSVHSGAGSVGSATELPWATASRVRLWGRCASFCASPSAKDRMGAGQWGSSGWKWNSWPAGDTACGAEIHWRELKGIMAGYDQHEKTESRAIHMQEAYMYFIFCARETHPHWASFQALPSLSTDTKHRRLLSTDAYLAWRGSWHVRVLVMVTMVTKPMLVL